MTLPKNIRYLRLKKDWSQDYLADALGYKSYTTIQKWETGVSEPPLKTLAKLAELFDVEIDDLAKQDLTEPMQSAPPIAPNTYTAIPVYGRIPAGGPAEAIEYQEGVIYVPAEEAKDNNVLALKVSGDSMYPEYKDGDIVVIRRQSDCENGQDCAVRINGYDATLKKVLKEDKGIILQPINPEYKAQYYTFDNSAEQVEIIGIVTEVRRKKI